MSRLPASLSAVCAAVLLSPPAAAEPQFTFGGEVESVFWANDAPVLGLLKQGGTSTFSPRLRLEAEALLSPRWFLHANVALDRGFDPHDQPDGQLRLDEVLLRYRPFGDGTLNLQVGKFATVFGSWVGGHRFHDDAFLLAPLPYEQIIGVPVRNPGGVSPVALAARARGAAPGVLETRKRPWGATIWGPNYSAGAAAFGSSGRFDYALEVKSSGLSSHPITWEADADEFESPTVSGRFGYRPDAAWAFGISASRGPYLEPTAEAHLPRGLDRGDLPHTLLGLDARWSHGDWIFSGEVIGSEFETFEVGELRSLSWFLQARWKAAPGFWLAGRFGQTFNNEVRLPAGAEVPWSPDLWRAELAAGWRITPDLLFKANYAFTSVDGDSEVGEHIFGGGFGWRF